jgi:hypothetical protein
MGNTSSTGKDKKPGLPNQAARSIQADDSDDEAAYAAGEPIVESAAPEPKNPLQIAAIANLVAKYVPDKSFKPSWFRFGIKAQSALASTSTLFHAATQGSRIAHKCALLASWGEEEKIKQLFNISPAHIGYMIAKADFEDPAGRKMYCSAFQYALWAGDWHLWDMMLKALDKADACAFPQADLDAIPAEEKRRKPYLGAITKEKIIAIRALLFEQYKEVVDTGLDYTRTRYDRVQDAAGKYQLTNPRTVQVCGETHCDLKGPEFCLMRKDEQFPLKKNKLYVRIEDGALHYQVIALSGEAVKGSIDLLAALQCPLLQLDNPDQLKPYIHKILKITAERDHTHPQALISAFETYFYGLDNHWNIDELVQQWCGGVGMAERFEATAVVAQEMCRNDVFLHVGRGQFKEPRFPRTLEFFNYENANAHTCCCYYDEDEYWVSAVGHTRLGLDFGIVHWRDGSIAMLAPEWWEDFGGGPSAACRLNSAALSALCTVRTIDIAELRNKLDPANLLGSDSRRSPNPQ